MAAVTRKLLRVNLSNRKVKEEPIDEAVAKDFIGGRGLGVLLPVQGTGSQY